MKFAISDAIAASIVKEVSVGLALFNATDLCMVWCNANFKKQTWFGGAFGSKTVSNVRLLDLFDKKDHAAVTELFNIANTMGQAYDFQRMVRRGPVGSFPAELKIRRMSGDHGDLLICLEITDLSINKLYEELKGAHVAMRERIADLMAAQAELQHSVRMNTISEVGADLAHQIINPVTICRDILQKEVLPLVEHPAATAEIHQSLRYLKNIQDLAVWFRKFSNPRISETQICNMMSMVEDALTLNMYRFSKQGLEVRIRKEESFNPFVLAIPVNLIMWLNAAFGELSAVASHDGGTIYVDLAGDDDTVTLSVHSSAARKSSLRVVTTTLEKFAGRLPGSAKFESRVDQGNISFCLTMACFADSEQEEPAPTSHTAHFVRTGSTTTSVEPEQHKFVEKLDIQLEDSSTPLVLIVDDERDIRRLLKRSFKNMNLETLEASDGLEALELFQKVEKKNLVRRIRAIVCDVRMPRMTGPHLLVKLRELGIDIPFIFFSSNLLEQEPNFGFKDSQVYYFTKDAGLDELKGVVARCMAPLPEAG